MSLKDPPDEPELFGGSVLGPDGRIERADPSRGSPGEDESLERASRDEPLELQERPAAPEPPPIHFGTPAPPPRRGRSIALAVVVLAVGFALWALSHGVRFTREGALPIVLIDSEPAGAEVRVAGELLGNTPLVFQNRYPEHPIPVEISTRGYRTWYGSFRGGREVKLEVKLQPEKR